MLITKFVHVFTACGTICFFVLKLYTKNITIKYCNIKLNYFFVNATKDKFKKKFV